MTEEALPSKRTVHYGGGREALLRASAEIIAEGGLRELTYRNVATRAGVVHGLVRHYFGSREALIKASLEYCVEQSIAYSGFNEPNPSIDTFASKFSKRVAADPGSHVFQYELTLQSTRQKELRPLVEHLHAEYRKAMVAELEAMGFGNNPVLANLVFAAIEGLVFEQVALGDPTVTEDAIKLLREILKVYKGTLPTD